MKKVLLLAYFFPPRGAAGSPRAAYIAKYLPRFDWQVSVMTPKFQNGEPPSWASILETDYSDTIGRIKHFLRISKNVSAHTLLGSLPPKANSKMTVRQRFVEASFSVLAFPDPHIGWLQHAARAAKRELESGAYSAVVSTSFPYTAHLAVRRALRGKPVPWLADLRDPWRGNSLITGIPAILHTELERKTLSHASAISTVSAPIARQIKQNYPATPVYEIRNSFDPDDWIGVEYKRPEKFTITYAGSLYQGLRDPEPLFDALRDEINAGFIHRERVELILYVQREDWLIQAIEQRGLQDIVAIKGYVEREQVLRAERATSVNLLLLRDLAGEDGVYTGKLFEYIGARLPIISFGGPEQSVVRELLARIGGSYATSYEELRATLRSFYHAHINDYDLKLNQDNVEPFSAIKMAERFAEVLNSIQPIATA